MGSYEDYFDGWEEYYDWLDFDEIEDLIDQMEEKFKPVNYDSWDSESQKKFARQAEDKLDKKHDRDPKLVRDGEKAIKDSGKKVSKRDQKTLFSINKKIHSSVKLNKTESKLRNRIVFLRATDIQRTSNLDRSEALHEAWKDWK